MIKRNQTRPIYVGDVQIGHQAKPVIQTMAKSRPSNLKQAIKEINTYATEGAHLVRFSVLDQADAKAFKALKQATSVPLVADIHFNHTLALLAMEHGADKIRINPGNIGSKDKVEAVVLKAKARNIPIRIGINAGSLDAKIIKRYGHTAEAMVQSALEHVKTFEALGFYDIIISLKASDVNLTIEANRLAAKTFNYPLHLGLTEAGPVYQGIIKSSAALGALLHEGIGDTIRISLSGERLEELKACKTLLASFNLYEQATIIACPTCGRLAYEMEPVISAVQAYLDQHPSTLKIAIMGCAVNGPGEARDADVGIAGGKHEALLFVKGVVVKKVPQTDLAQTLIEAIKNYEH